MSNNSWVLEVEHPNRRGKDTYTFQERPTGKQLWETCLDIPISIARGLAAGNTTSYEDWDHTVFTLKRVV